LLYGTEVTSFEEFVTQFFGEIINASALDESERKVELNVMRQSRLSKANLLLTELGIRNWQPPVAPIINEVRANSPAANLGLILGDKITSFNGVKINTWGELVAQIQQYPGQSIDISYVRAGVERSGLINIGERANANTTTIRCFECFAKSYNKDLGYVRIKSQYVQRNAQRKYFCKEFEWTSEHC